MGESRTIQFAITIDDELLATQNVRNTVSIADDGANGPELNTGDNQATEDTPMATGQITGNVFDDLNMDGFFDSGDRPLGGVVINLEGQDIYGNNYALTTTTDANGNYTFTGLATGNYRITQQQPAGFVDGQDSTGSPGGVVSGNDEITISLNAGESAPANNFGEVADPTAVGASKRAFLSSRFSDGYADVSGSIQAATGPASRSSSLTRGIGDHARRWSDRKIGRVPAERRIDPSRQGSE